MSRDVEYDAVEGMAREIRAGRGTQKPGTIQARQDTLWRTIETLDNVLDSLSVRLSAVLLPERPSPALTAAEADPADTSDHGAFLDHAAARVESLGRRVAELSQRIDL
jgi:uncharacterized protein YceH (UPF0502 family)